LFSMTEALIYVLALMCAVEHQVLLAQESYSRIM
jgi:hypothetical protein